MNAASKLRRPAWLKKKLSIDQIAKMNRYLSDSCLNTVCNSAQCPNRGECFAKKIASFMILGNVCTRDCRFCDVPHGKPKNVDKEEPIRLAKSVKELGIRHAVITSVTRDDLPDKGAGQFIQVIKEMRKLEPKVSVEILIPDFGGNKEFLKQVIVAGPDILNHNIEMTQRLYKKVRPHSDYKRSLEVLRKAKKIAITLGGKMLVKSGFMVGIGETEEEIFELIEILYNNGCDMLTIGQYLQPSLEHYSVKNYVHPDKFKEYEAYAKKIGFKYVAAGPYVRSSYMAEEMINDSTKHS